MRPRIWVILAAVVLALGFGFTGRATETSALDSLSGLAWLVAIIAAISLLPFWSKVLPKIEPMPGLFKRPAEGERWCVQCGSPTVKLAACHVCGAEPKLPKKKAPKKPKEASKVGKKAAKGDT